MFYTGPLGAPVFINQQSPSYSTVYRNHVVTLKCEAVGDTPITITWTHKGQVLQSKTSDTHLTLTSVTKAQEGFYNCSASNTLRTNSKMFYLHVKGMVWCGVVWVLWYGMVWYGMVWYGIEWYGMV